MKKILISSIFILLNISLFSQNWIGNNAKWTFDYMNIGLDGTYVFNYTNDTIILGKDCEAIEITKHRYWNDENGDTHSSHVIQGKQYTYSSGDSVFHLYGGSFYLLYDFSASVGDTWVIAVDSNSICDDTAMVQVTQTGTVNINNQVLRTITLATISNTAIGLTGTCVEKFGCEPQFNQGICFGPFPGYQNCDGSIVDYDIFNFRCYVDDNFETYNPTNIGCNYLTGLNEIVKSDFRIYPNPTNGKISIEAENIVNIEIMNIEGKQIYIGKVNKVDLTAQPKGIYIIKVVTDKQSITKKIVKQ